MTRAAPSCSAASVSKASTSSAWAGWTEAVGSSASTTPGRWPSARATAARCRCPTETWAGIRSSTAAMPSRAASAAVRAGSARPRMRWGSMMLSRKDRNGSSAPVCGTKPMARPRSAASASPRPVRQCASASCPDSASAFPASGRSARASSASSVLLPHPDGPVTAMRPPGGRARWSTRSVKPEPSAPKLRDSPCACSAGGVTAGLRWAPGTAPPPRHVCRIGPPTSRCWTGTPDTAAAWPRCCSARCAGRWRPWPANPPPGCP